ncbi:MAG: energy-coupling factor ABC transporter ATP-binding protein [Propioniciclava sp.]
MSAVARLTEVRFTYPGGVEALAGVSLTIEAGERVAIVGQNGAGKTTLARHLNGIVSPTAGTVEVAGMTTTGRTIADLAATVGYVFQNPDEQLFAPTVRTDVEYGPRNLGLTRQEATARAMRALAAVGLLDQARAHPHDLPIGARKRVALAGVLAMETPVVVLDEPTTGQDLHGVEMIAAVVQNLADQGRTIIAITHDPDFCAEHFDRVIVMAQGQILADGPVSKVFADAEALARAGVEPPQLFRLARHLGWTERPLTPADFVAAYRTLRSG